MKSISRFFYLQVKLFKHLGDFIKCIGLNQFPLSGPEVLCDDIIIISNYHLLSLLIITLLTDQIEYLPHISSVRFPAIGLAQIDYGRNLCLQCGEAEHINFDSSQHLVSYEINLTARKFGWCQNLIQYVSNGKALNDYQTFLQTLIILARKITSACLHFKRSDEASIDMP